MRIFTIIMIGVLLKIPYLPAQDYQYLEYQNEQVMQTKQYQKGNDYQKDFLLFMDLLQTTHPAFAPEQQHPLNVDSLTKTGYQHLESCRTLTDFQFFLLSIIVPLHDGHTFVSLFQGDDTNVLYPINIRTEDHIPYIQAIEKEHENALGKQITLINGLSISNIYNIFGRILIAENENFFESQIFEWILFPHTWNYIPQYKNDSLLQLTFHDGTSIYVKAKNRADITEIVFIQPEIINADITLYQDVPFFYTILEKERIAYLQFNNCTDQNSVRHYYENSGYVDENGFFSSELEGQIQQYPRFDTLLFSMFSKIKSNNITALVVDVRYNSGGNSELCKQLLSYLVPNIDDLQTTNSVIRISDFLIQYYSEWYDVLCKNLPYKIETRRLYNSTELSIEDSAWQENNSEKYFKMNRDTSLVFDGTTIFIQGKRTYSSAGILLVEARDNEIGIIIGKNSTYRPCNFGDILFWKLPNTKIMGGVSHKYFTRPNKSKCHEDYLAPDVYIPTTLEDYKTGKDPCWEWIKSNYFK